MTHISRHIALKNLVAGLVSTDTLDMLWTSRDLLMIPKRSSLVITFFLLRKFNLGLDLLCGDQYTFFRSRPYIDRQSVSRLDYYSRKDEQDTNSPMDENLPKYETFGKTGDTNAPKMTILNTSDIICRKFLIPPQEYGQSYRFILLKWLINMKKS